MTSPSTSPSPPKSSAAAAEKVAKECRQIGRLVGVGGAIVGGLGFIGGFFAATGEYGEMAPSWPIIGASIVFLVTALWAGALLVGLAEVIEQLRRR